MYTITKRITFDAAHRLSMHAGKCANIHGHSYVAEVTLSAPHLNSNDMIADLGVIKKLIQAWIDVTWDHSLILNSSDPVAKLLANIQVPVNDCGCLRLSLLESEDPTAEAMAQILFQVTRRLIEEDSRCKGARVLRVRLYETSTGWAEYEEEAADV